MPIGPDTIEQLAHLARLKIEANEVQNTLESLNRILKMVDEINSANTNGIEPMAHPLSMKPLSRPDQVTESNQRDILIKNATKTALGLYLVPTVLE